MPVWLSYPQWRDNRSRLGVIAAIHKAHVYDLETVLSLEQLGLPLDLAQLVTGFFPKYSDRVAMAFAKALFMGGQKMSRHERKICNKVFNVPSKAYHYLNANSEWVEACCSVVPPFRSGSQCICLGLSCRSRTTSCWGCLMDFRMYVQWMQHSTLNYQD